MNIGLKIRQRRLELGMTLLEVANKLGVQEATVQRYESGVIKNIPLSKIKQLSQILKTNPEWLMEWNIKNKSIRKENQYE